MENRQSELDDRGYLDHYHAGRHVLQVNSSRVDSDNDPFSDKGLYIGVCIGAAVLLLILMGLIIAFMKKKTRSAPPSPRPHPIFLVQPIPPGSLPGTRPGSLPGTLPGSLQGTRPGTLPSTLNRSVDINSITVRGPLVQGPAYLGTPSHHGSIGETWSGRPNSSVSNMYLPGMDGHSHRRDNFYTNGTLMHAQRENVYANGTVLRENYTNGTVIHGQRENVYANGTVQRENYFNGTVIPVKTEIYHTRAQNGPSSDIAARNRGPVVDVDKHTHPIYPQYSQGVGGLGVKEANEGGPGGGDDDDPGDWNRHVGISTARVYSQGNVGQTHTEAITNPSPLTSEHGNRDELSAMDQHDGSAGPSADVLLRTNPGTGDVATLDEPAQGLANTLDDPSLTEEQSQTVSGQVHARPRFADEVEIIPSEGDCGEPLRMPLARREQEEEIQLDDIDGILAEPSKDPAESSRGLARQSRDPHDQEQCQDLNGQSHDPEHSRIAFEPNKQLEEQHQDGGTGRTAESEEEEPLYATVHKPNITDEDENLAPNDAGGEEAGTVWQDNDMYQTREDLSQLGGNQIPDPGQD